MDAIPQITAAVVVVLLLGILWWSSKKTQSGSIGWLSFSVRGNRSPQGTARIQVLGCSHLTANHQLHLVQSMEQVFLICTHSAGSSVISSQPVAAVSDGAAAQDVPR